MPDSIQCSYCGNRLLLGVSSGKLLCPACRKPLPKYPPGRGPGQPENGRAAFDPRWRPLRFAALAVCLVAALGFAGWTLRNAMLPLTHNTDVEAGGVQDPTDMMQLFERMPVTDAMRDYLIRAEAASLSDARDFGLGMGLLSCWRQWYEVQLSHNPGNAKVRELGKDFPRMLQIYDRVAVALHTRQDHKRLMEFFYWMQELRSRALPQGPIVGPPSGPTIGSTEPKDEKARELADTKRIQEKDKMDAYGWRRHAEILMDMLDEPGYFPNQPQSRSDILAQVNQELTWAEKVARTKILASTLARDFSRMIREYGVR